MAKLDERFALKESTGYWLRHTYNAVSESLQGRFDQYDITVAQWPVLYSLYHDEKHTPAELAEHLGLNRSAITRLLDRLEKKQLINRATSSQDKRSVSVTLTEAGLKLVPHLAEISRDTNNHVLSGLSLDEIKQFDETLRKVHANASY
jgi:DNA-binding MarR family transcriptional regulator